MRESEISTKTKSANFRLKILNRVIKEIGQQ